MPGHPGHNIDRLADTALNCCELQSTVPPVTPLSDLFRRRRSHIFHNKILNIWRNAMEFFASAIDTMKVTVVALGGGLGAWGIINLLEGYGNDNPGANAHVR